MNFFEIKKMSVALPIPSLYVIKVPFLTQYFQMIQNSGDPADVWL